MSSQSNSTSYMIDIMADCENENDRKAIEKSILSMVSSLKISSKNLTNNSSDDLIEMNWSGTNPSGHFEIIKSKLLELAERFSICFEVDLNTEDQGSGTIFIGVGAISKELDYIQEELQKLLPRLERRKTLLAEQFHVSEKDIARAIATLSFS